MRSPGRFVLGAALIALFASACDFSSEGDFDGVGFAPGATVFAVHDRHTFLTAGGETTAIRRPDNELGLTLLLSDVSLDPRAEWRRYRASRLLEIKKDLAVKDGLLIENLPLSELAVGDDVEFQFLTNARKIERPAANAPFDRTRISIVSALPGADAPVEQGFGEAITLQLTLDTIDVGPSRGTVAGRIDLKRDRAEGQEGEIATGQVTLRFVAPIVNERVGKANLAHLAPVMRCAAERGPSRAGGCRDEAPEPIVDETSTLLPAP